MMYRRYLIAALVGLLLAGVSSTEVQAQDLLREGRLNEVKTNVPSDIAGTLDLSYERVLLEDLAVGASLQYAWDDVNIFDLDNAFMVLPYARWFFWKHRGQDRYPGAGFFIEVNSGLFGGTKDPMTMDGADIKLKGEQITGWGLGLALGWKWISKSGFVGEVYSGAGRNFLSSSDEVGIGAYLRMGVSLGYRF